MAFYNFVSTTGLKTVVDKFPPKDSPDFTGTPTAPTATQGTDTNQIATTAFVKNELSAAIGDAISGSY